QTPVGKWTKLGTVEGAGAARRSRGCARARINQERRLAASCFRFHRRNSAVWWVDDDRPSLFAVHGDHRRPASQPEVVVTTDRAAAETFQDFQIRFRRRGVAANRRSATVWRKRRIVLHLTLRLVCFHGQRFFASEIGAGAKLRRPLERRDRGDFVGALKIGMAVGGTGIRRRCRWAG